MKRKIFAFLLVFIFFVAINLAANQIPGSQYFYLGNGISYFPLGGSGVASFMTMDSNLYNPASFADTKRITADLSAGGFLGSNFLMNGRGSFPTNYGIITGNLLFLSSPEGDTAGTVVGLKGTFSKFISDEWLFGAAINLGLGKGPESDFNTSLDLGTIYRKPVAGTGFGLFDYSLGVALKNIGKNISYSGYSGFPPFEIDLGGRTEVYRSRIYKTRMNTHFSLPLNPFHVFFGFGIENIFLDMINVKLGLNFGIEEISPFCFGFDLNFNLEDTDIQCSYSFLPISFNGKDEYTHNAGISVAFGNYDKKPPKTIVVVENTHFSPNHDGINDKAKFNLDIEDNTMVFGWQLDINDENGKPVKSFVAQDVRKIRHMTFVKFAKRIFSKKEEVKIPKFVEWDGEDLKGNIVKDGKYNYTLSAWDENNNKNVTERIEITVDTLVPMVEAKSDLKLFSPNSDGVKDILRFNIKSENIEKDDKIVLNILDKENNTVFEKELVGSVPEEFIWDGKDQSGSIVNEGVYNFSISALDKAGNKTISRVENIVVKTEYEKVSVSPFLRTFSPNSDGYYDIDQIRLFSSSKAGLINWKLDISDEKGNIAKSYLGERDFPDSINFDGKSDKGMLLRDGLYTLKFSLNFESGNHPESYFKFLKIDNTAPKIDVTSNINAFSPNGDGIKDTISIVHKIEADEGDIFEAKIVDVSGKIFKTFVYGEKAPNVVIWDGMGDNNTQPVEGIYTYVVVGKDNVGNSTEASFGPIKLATGFEKISLEPGDYVFSPNGDGIKDIISFNLNTDNRQGIVEWKVSFRDEKGDVVKSFSDKTMGIVLPINISWDGATDYNSLVEDGVYTGMFSILYDTGNNPISKPKEVKVDTKSPEIEVYADDLYISPNGDGAKEVLVVNQRIKGEPEDSYEAIVTDYTGKAVKKFSWVGNPPSKIVWDGRNEKGEPLPEGIYNYKIIGKDVAGNTDKKEVVGIILTTTYEKVSIIANQEGISPNGDGFLDEATFVPSISSEKDLSIWYLDFINNQGRKVREIKGVDMPPSIIKWDGKDEKGNVVSDGKYSYILNLIYKSGNHPASKQGEIIVDITPPDYNFVISPKLFSPDNDGESDTLYINTEVFDKNDVTNWDVSIYRKWNNRVDRNIPFKRFSGTGNVKEMIKWNGYSDPINMPTNFIASDAYSYKKVGNKWQVLVDSASNYIAELKAVDRFKNAITVSKDFETDILVIKTPYGLKIMINSIQFEFDKSDILPTSYKILDRLIQITDKFPNYKINIVGHTDWMGTEEYNQKLSEKRAYSVYKYLVEHDVDKDRLTTEGKGETQPIDDNNSEVGRARNRRVEFYLTKK